MVGRDLELIMKKVKGIIKRLIRKMGYYIVKYETSSNPIVCKRKLLESYKIDFVIDVGANVGQFGKHD